MDSKYNYHVINYCDDFILINNYEKCKDAFEKLSTLLKKLIPPTKLTTCLGIAVDTTIFQVSIPE